jgi:hypothetical protein
MALPEVPPQEARCAAFWAGKGSRVVKDHQALYVVVCVEEGEIDVIAVYDVRATAERCCLENGKTRKGTYWVADCNLFRGDWEARREELAHCPAWKIWKS